MQNMGVSVKADFDMQAIRSYIENQGKKRIKEYAIANLKEAGYKFVTAAWQNAEFQNHTYDLRSSIGYMVLDNGVVIAEMFRSQGDSTDGAPTGKRIAQEEAPKNELCLIVVAGMFYAVYVEAYGFDVITNSSVIAKNLLNKALSS